MREGIDTTGGNAPFGFTPGWWDLGIIDEAILARLQAAWDTGEDENPEHYRYWALRQFFARHRPLAPEMVRALWELAEADLELGLILRSDLILRPECPEALIEAALASGDEHLARMVAKRRSVGHRD